MSSKFLFLLIFLALFTRFFGQNWGNSYFSHPDENNMATALSQLSSTNINPHFFAYGQFPLYLGYFTLKIVNVPNTFPNSIYILRFYSAIFSLIFLYFAYLLSKEIFHHYLSSMIFSLLLIFSPGLIQIAHFGTTESLLSFVFIANLYYLLKIYEKPKFKYFFIVSVLSGLALGSKITAIFFIWPIVIVGLFKKQYLSSLFFILLTCFIFLLTSPYNIIDINDFVSSMNYESAVAMGTTEVFYTRQFLNTVPYLFQFTHVFPYVVGLPIFVFGVLGFLSLPPGRVKSSPINYKYLLIILIPVLIYFLYFGSLFVKWTRFMSPMFFIFPLFATIFISKLKFRYQVVFTLFCLVPGLLFMSQYLLPNPRITATNWLNNKLPQNATILSESGNVTDLNLRHDINVINFDFYSLDENYENKLKLDHYLSFADFVLIPSRRIFKNQNSFMFPNSQNYYQTVFSNKYQKIYQSSNFDFFLNYESAEETFTVFDYPTIRLFKKL